MEPFAILLYPDERLKTPSEPVRRFDDSLREFVARLEHTMRGSPGGVGIAAPQVGRLERIAIVDVSARRRVAGNGRMVLVNPEIVSWDGMTKGREGCMSVPDFTGNVMRAERITVAALDETGKRREYQCEGFEARAVQHEIDHLDGLLFLDRLVSRRTDLFRRKNYDNKKTA
ncbi:MAG TPA: peptide deformylase [Gammaproteobacteria bacterium]|nr:peptide deformylase [Gammaproteobacteria bacterium]